MAKRVSAFSVRSGFVYLRKWTPASIATGIVAGLGALALIQRIGIFTKLFLGTIVGYAPPLPGGETVSALTTVVIERPWLILGFGFSCPN